MTHAGVNRRSGGSRSQSPEHPVVMPPFRRSLHELSAEPQSSPRVQTPRDKIGPSSPNQQSARARQGNTPGQKNGNGYSPRFGTPPNSARESVRDSARDSARKESARRRQRESVKEHVRRRNCTSTGQRSSVGKEQRPNPLLYGKGTPSSVRRSPRVPSPEDEGGTASTNCSVNGPTISSPGSTPVRRPSNVRSSSGGTNSKHRRHSAESQKHEPSDVVRAMVSRLSIDGDGGHIASLSYVEADEIDGPSEYHNTPLRPSVGIPVIAASAVTASAISRASVDRRTSVDPITARSEGSSCSSSAAPTEELMGNPRIVPAIPVDEQQPSQAVNRDMQGFRMGHKKTPSFHRLPEHVENVTVPLDNGALPSARTMSSSVPASADEHLDCYDDLQDDELQAGMLLSYRKSPGSKSEQVTLVKAHYEDFPPYYTVRLADGREKQTIRENLAKSSEDDYDSLAGSTGGRVEALCEKVQHLVLEMSAGMAACATPSVAPAPVGTRAAGMGPGRPPRYRPPYSSMGSLSASLGHPECHDDELHDLKFRISNLELNLNSARGDPRGQPDGCCVEVDTLKRQLRETQGQLFDAKEEIQQAKGEICALAHRLNQIPTPQSAFSGSTDASRSVSAPMHVLTPRPPSAAVVAVGTPVLSARQDVQPSGAYDVQSSRSYGSIEVQVTPLTPSIQRQASMPQAASATVPASATASPMTSSRIQRRPSSPQPQTAQACHVSSQMSLAHSTGSFTPQPRVFVGAPCESARASPLRAQPLPPHMQSAPCIANTPPASARVVGSQMSFTYALGQEDLLARGAQLSYQPAIQSARNTPIRSKLAPAHVARSPRIAG